MVHSLIYFIKFAFLYTLRNMQADNRNQRIARNTLMLYIRMFALLLVGLYTSRVVLEALGENDYGIYNVVGGVVAMFTMISGALNSAVSRFITFEMGKGEGARLQEVFSTAVTIQFILAVIVVVIAEPVGLWFINNEMTIDPSRIPAARWVLHFSLFSFVINLMSVPQMASITAHERMSAYAAIGILDSLLRLSVAFLIMKSPVDRLVYYAALMSVTVLIVRAAYGFYCRRHFPECRFRPVCDGSLIKEMFSFAGWNFIGVSAGVLRDQGGNILVNLFYGTAVNAARGVAVQLNSAIQGFVSNFMTAVNPQITKSYAGGDLKYMFSLVRRSSRMSFCLLLVIALPVLFNTEYILSLWLKDVPAHTALFVRLFLVFALCESLSGPLVTAQLATGRIRNYQIVVGGLMLLNIPVSYILLRLGAMAEITVVVAIVLSLLCLVARLVMLQKMIGLPVGRFLTDVCLRSAVVAAASVVLPAVLTLTDVDGLAGFALSVTVCVTCTAFSSLYIGMSGEERKGLLSMLKKGGTE